MKSLSFVFVATFLFLTASCNPVNDSDELELNGDIKQVVFFSDDENYRQEASYYDAIIELKKEYPSAFDDIVVIPAANANKYYDLFKVKQFPAILIVHQDQVLANVNGNVTKDQIIEPLSAVLNNE
ncbi:MULTISPECIES: small peptidoglycan-associated lipoprotein [unclassified Bacillus (in: firmicutes)]|uniref:small peptidoglycan-associated lipoprotein n=1 Tax=unclassified Bacillus (in: firmicutes) TaxID=185979 RepID=UPI001BE863DC|nr:MULTISPECIES: small peptidoglycan-associated lipoprotein [unclassified Bacillus (in: firmicutes)]MBT2637303.1 small peptidoglycan-associated lipoprotein [Bacillus sp. ISL-39]MBT2660376.1 small peptidoglycan-associated lipoprotein [Bacillus sp. ISL-45]